MKPAVQKIRAAACAVHASCCPLPRYSATGEDERLHVGFHAGGLVWNCWTGALAHLGVARANALLATTAQTTEAADPDAARARARSAYNDFFRVWKDADPNIPILKQAKAEYAKLH